MIAPQLRNLTLTEPTTPVEAVLLVQRAQIDHDAAQTAYASSGTVRAHEARKLAESALKRARLLRARIAGWAR